MSSCGDLNSAKDVPQKKIYSDSQFVMGADLSYVNAILESPTEYRTTNAIVQNPYQIFKDLGTNLVRVRKWHTPSWQIPLYGQIKYHDLRDIKQTIQQSKLQGMAVLLDLHYSDNWADPHKQEVPKAWDNLPLDVLSDSIYRYTFDLLAELRRENLLPEYIQIGNENNAGICHPLGRIVGQNFDNFCTLIHSGIRAVKDFSDSSNLQIKVILHVAQFQNAEWWLKGIQNSNIILDFDILGISHYYKWSQYHEMKDITDIIHHLKNISQKDIWILETAFPWTMENNDDYPNILSNEGLPKGYSISKEGQNKYLRDLTQAIIDGGGKGLIYWEPAWISSPLKDQWGKGSSWENNTFFDFQNRVHNTLDYMTFSYDFK